MVRWRSGMEAAVLVALVALTVPTPAPAQDPQADSLAAVLREVTGKTGLFLQLPLCVYLFWALLYSLDSVQRKYCLLLSISLDLHK